MKFCFEAKNEKIDTAIMEFAKQNGYTYTGWIDSKTGKRDYSEFPVLTFNDHDRTCIGYANPSEVHINVTMSILFDLLSAPKKQTYSMQLHNGYIASYTDGDDMVKIYIKSGPSIFNIKVSEIQGIHDIINPKK